jgi:hypothetical protein
MVETIFSFSSLGKYLDIFDIEAELLGPDFAVLFQNIRGSLLDRVHLKSEAELATLMRMVVLLLLPEEKQSGHLSDSKATVLAEPYSKKKIALTMKRLTGFYREIQRSFQPLTNSELFGAYFQKTLDEYWQASNKLAHHYFLLQIYFKVIGNPSSLISEIEKLFPQKEAGKIFQCLVDGITENQDHDLSETVTKRSKKIWNNFLKYRSKIKSKRKKHKKKHKQATFKKKKRS